MLVLLGLLPVATYVLVCYALRPATEVFAPVRLTLVRAGLVVAAVAVTMVEVLGAAHALTHTAIVATWAVETLLALVAAALRYRRDGRLANPFARLRAAWHAPGVFGQIIVVVLAALLIGELIIAVASPPDNYDSQTYHLPRIEHWVQQRDLTLWATAIPRQLAMSPGAEYLLLHTRLLTDGNHLYNLLQYAAGLGCAIIASRIAGQLGGSPRAQMIAALVTSTTPMVALESTSTQTDLVMAVWVASLATLVLEELRRRTALPAAVLIGLAAGLATETKANALIAIGPLLLLWGIAQLRLPAPRWWRAVPRAAGSSAVIVAAALAVTVPFMVRMDHQYGNPLGPLGGALTMQRHDPQAIVVNGLRIGFTAFDTPSTRLHFKEAHAIERIAHKLNVDPNDPEITFVQTFPPVTWKEDEDVAALPVQGAIVLLGAAFLLIRPGRRVPAGSAWPARAYAIVFWVSTFLFVAMVKWQQWENRLLMYLLVLGTPLAGLWLDRVLRRLSVPVWREATAALTVAALIGCSIIGLDVLRYGHPRHLFGPGSVLTTDRMTQLFSDRRPQWKKDFEATAAAIRASGAHRIGLVQGNDDWEYPWWLLLPGREIESEQTVAANLKPVAPDQVDAMICVNTTIIPASACQRYVPHGWQVHRQGYIQYALPPRQ